MHENNEETLVVDLDGTLLRSDMLFESFWSGFSIDWRVPFSSLAALARGRADLKQHLREVSQVDPATLPFDAEVIAYVQAHRARGGRTALVTASDQAFADRIAAHLDLFDAAHGSDGTQNLKGAAKAQFLNTRFGAGSFAYMGDCAVDMPVWKEAARVITVNASEAVRQQAAALGKPTEHLGAAAAPLLPYLKAMRPHQWLKNILVFLPMLAAHELNWSMFFLSLTAFMAFSLTASSAYILNDLLDLNADRAHPRKFKRPFASGTASIAHGTFLAPALALLGALIAVVFGGLWCLLAVVTYYVLTLAYSLNFKRRIVIDICFLAGLYTMRIIVGGFATGIPLSVWLLAFSIFFFFSLASVKRQAELVDMAERNEERAKGRGYQVEDLPIVSMMALSAGYVSVLVMALYVNSPSVLELYANPAALWAICCTLLYWVTRMVFVTHRGYMHDDPVVYAAKDRVSQICFVTILVFGVLGAVW